MDNKDTLSRTTKETTLGSNSDYYKYVFKKTEKIVCAVFYILRANKDISQADTLVKNIEDTAERVTRASFRALRATEGESEWAGKELGYMLMELESALRVGHAGRILQQDHLQVFVVEIDSVLRSLKEYTHGKMQNPLADIGVGDIARERVRARSKNVIATEDLSQLRSGQRQEGVKESRTERVLAILKDKGQASIKDISEVITDCSEKTIQRELTALIKDNKITREGERRWSKYSLV